MSLIVPDFTESVVVRHTAAEVIGQPPITVRLLADSSSTGGALSTQRVTLGNGADGAKPHHHANSAELFYLVDGTAQLLSGDQVQDVCPSAGLRPASWPRGLAACPNDRPVISVASGGTERKLNDQGLTVEVIRA